VLDMTQRIGPARTARYSARVVSIRALHSSLPHSQNTVIAWSPAVLSWNPSISPAIRSLTLTAETAALQLALFCCHVRPFPVRIGSRCSATDRDLALEPVRYGRLAEGR
jgi:hypothetical protein